MTGLETIVCAAILAGFAVHAFRRKKRVNHGLPHLEKVMQGCANEEQLLELADALAKSVISSAKSGRKPPLFVTASGDVYDDFFPPRELREDCTAEQYANAVLADCVNRYREARRNRNVDISDFHAYALCAGAGLAVSAFRRLAEYSSDMRDLAEFLAPVPAPEDWADYLEYYRQAGELLDVPKARVDARLLKRREAF